MMSAIRDLTGPYVLGYVVCVILSVVALPLFASGRTKRYSAKKCVVCSDFALFVPGKLQNAF